jgi:Peptidase A4 family
LQTGTTQQIIYGGSTSTWAWFEWFPAKACTISNLAVSPGDVMYGLICIYTSAEAHIYLGNMTTGQLVSFVKDGSSEGLSVAGDSAEWILECPQDQNDDFYLLTKFGDIYFDNCLAGTNGPHGPQTLFGGGYADLIMEGAADDNVSPIAAPLSLNDRAFKVQYVVPP